MSDLARLDRLLEQLKTECGQLETQTASLKARIEQIEMARRTLRVALGYEDGPLPDPASSRAGSLANKTILEAAVAVLAARGEPTHFKVIAREAAARGFGAERARTPGQLEQSFWDTLRRAAKAENPQVRFLRKGVFELTPAGLEAARS